MRRLSAAQGFGLAGLLIALTALLFHLRALSPDSADSAEISRFVEQPIWVWYLRWPLTHLVAQALHRGLGWPGADCLALWSSVAGALFLVTVGALARRSPLAPIILLSSATLTLIGHVEVYAWPHLILLWLLLLGPLHLRGRVPLTPIVSLFALGCLLHMLLAFYAPALIWLAWRGRRLARARGEERRDLDRDLANALVRALLFLGAVVVMPLVMHSGGLDNDLERLVPLTMPEVLRSSNQVTLLSPAHLAAIGIFLLMSCPVGLPIVVARLGRIRGDEALAFTAIAAVCGLVFLLVWHPDMGWRGDWDLFSHPGLVINVLAWQLLQRDSHGTISPSPPAGEGAGG